ncbi:MAG: electron transfer flavoprotein subunit beta [Spirochaetae bacterium HGW-Spirochaetae-1]|nr:MAG: electron transfer flavoprotein subunit beta [Spirochaetae bacterium HGW-Spirochaetae-1]
MLTIAVCIKQVPDTHMVKIDPVRGTLERDRIPNIMNPDDMHAIEMALSLRGRYGGTVTAVTMGPPQAAEILEESYAMGVDSAVLVSDSCFAGSDSYVTGKILSRAIAGLGSFDIVITGVEAVDGSTASVGYHLSEFLHMPLITQIHKIDIEEKHAVIERLYGHEYQKIRVDLPLILSVNKSTNVVRFPALADIRTCFEKPIRKMTMEDIGGSEKEYGLYGSPTVVIQSESFVHARERETMNGNLQEKVEELLVRLKKHNIIRY